MTPEETIRLEEKVISIQNAIARIETNIEKMQNYCISGKMTCEHRFKDIEINAAVGKTKLGIIVTIVSLISSTIAVTVIKAAI